MRSGNLKHKITIQEIISMKNTLGEPTQDWYTFMNAWARIVPIRANEYRAAQGLVEKITHTVTIRYTDGIESDMRILYGSRVFEIKGILDFNEEHKRLDLMCEELPNG